MKLKLFTPLTVALSALFTVATAGDASADYVGSDGVVYESSVGAACDSLTSSVYFMPGDATLEIHDYAPLDYFAECMTDGQLEGVRVAVVGFTDPIGPARMNAELGEARAEAVTDYLIAQGVPETQLFPISFGESAAHAEDIDPSDWSTSRRVELWVIPDNRPFARR